MLYMSEDVEQEIPEALTPEDTKNRLAAAAEDIQKIANHGMNGNHPNINET
jgi:hypothetical protein